nr:unnamed protein product [Callosobruchus analis]
MRHLYLRSVHLYLQLDFPIFQHVQGSRRILLFWTAAVVCGINA